MISEKEQNSIYHFTYAVIYTVKSKVRKDVAVEYCMDHHNKRIDFRNTENDKNIIIPKAVISVE